MIAGKQKLIVDTVNTICDVAVVQLEHGKESPMVLLDLFQIIFAKNFNKATNENMKKLLDAYANSKNIDSSVFVDELRHFLHLCNVATA